MFSKEDFELELESRLNEFYHQKIVPLEKEIIRLGGKINIKEDDGQIIFKLDNFYPLDPFKEGKKTPYFWESNESEYYTFFKFLFEACFEKKWIQIIPLYNYDETLNYWMHAFGCNNKVDLVFSESNEDFLSPMLWKGNLNLFVYLIDKLFKEKYISSSRVDEAIKNRFFKSTSVGSIANTKSRLKHKTPSKSYQIDEVFDEILTRLD